MKKFTLRKKLQLTASGLILTAIISGCGKKEVETPEDEKDTVVIEETKDSNENVHKYTFVPDKGVETEEEVIETVLDAKDVTIKSYGEADVQDEVQVPDGVINLVINPGIKVPGVTEIVISVPEEIKKELEAHEPLLVDVTYATNFDGTHKKIITREYDDGSRSNTVIIEDCQYALDFYNENYEFRKCPDCGYTLMVKHVMSDGIVNKDGNTEYYCIHDDCDYSYIKEREDKPVVDITDDKDNRPVRPRPDYPIHVERPHTHLYVWQLFDKDKEKGICTCGDVDYRLHTFTDWTFGNLVDMRNCITCDYVESREHTHEMGEWIIGEEKDTRTCETCGKVEERVHNHKFGEWTIGEEKDTRTCETCGKVEERVHNHEFSEWTFGEEKDIRICGTCGKVEERAHEHDFELTYGEEEDTKTCKTCGKVEKSIHDHKFGEWIKEGITEKRTCETCGKVEEREHSHTFGEWTYNKNGDFRICRFCGEKEERAHKHEFGSWVTSGNVSKRVCGTCGYEEKYVHADSHTHSFGEWIYGPDKDIRRCSCGYVDSRNHSHSLSEWKFVGNGKDARTCSTCGTEETREHIHDFGEWTSGSDGNTRTCNSCGYVETMDHTHEFSEWNYAFNGKDTRICGTCGYIEERDHVHSEALEGLTYTYQKSNEDGTHAMGATYTCSICNQEVMDFKNVDCEYNPIQTYESVGITNPYNIHYIVDTCDVCGYKNKTEQGCTKVGDKKYVRIYDNIYEYYDCAVCGGYVDRNYHTVHDYGDWEYYDDHNHRRSCPCNGSFMRPDGTEQEGDCYYQEATHNMVEQDGQMVCPDCGYAIPLAPSCSHAYDEMDLMDLVLSPYYKDLLSKSQFSNPNPAPTDYCSRYDFKCSSCGAYYSIYYAHKFKDGKCTRGYCGHIDDPNYAMETSNTEALKLERKLNIPGY